MGTGTNQDAVAGRVQVRDRISTILSGNGVDERTIRRVIVLHNQAVRDVRDEAIYAFAASLLELEDPRSDLSAADIEKVKKVFQLAGHFAPSIILEGDIKEPTVFEDA